MVFITFNLLHQFRIKISNLECVVHSLKLEEGESKNWPFESHIRRETQPQERPSYTALWRCAGPLVVTLRKGPGDLQVKNSLPLSWL